MYAEKGIKPCSCCGKSVTRLLSQVKGERWFCDIVCRKAFLASKKTLIACAECGKSVLRCISQVRPIKERFCSMTCRARKQGRDRRAAGTWHQPIKKRRGNESPCGSCGKPVYRYAGFTKPVRYCSPACHDEGQRVEQVTVTCDQCGVQMQLSPSRAKGRRFCSQRCDLLNTTKRSDGRTINGRPVLKNSHGYITIYMPDHPASGKIGRVLEHRLVMEKKIGRYLRSDEHVDHINQIKDDNRPENLQILTSHDHSKKTAADRRAKALSLQEELEEYRKRFGELT